MKNTKISKYLNIKNLKSESINLMDWLNDETYKDFVAQIRSLTDKDEIKKLKTMLPCVTMSGVFSERKLSGLVEHSGFICIDIDAKENPHITNFSDLRDELKHIQNVSYSSLSVSGKGVFCLIKIEHPEKHKEHFKALQICFERLGIIIDKACSDVTRLRIYSYDPLAYINENAITFHEFFDVSEVIERQSKEKNTEVKNVPKASTPGNTNRMKVAKLIEKLNSNKIDITASYGDWFQIAAALANEFGDEGRKLFHSVSRNNLKYKESETDELFNGCLKTPYGFTIASFFHIVDKHL